MESLLCVSGKLCYTRGQPAAGRRAHQRPGCFCHLTAGGDLTKLASFRCIVHMLDITASPFCVFTQIPDIIRVGAKRYFGQTALGGPFHVILWAETIIETKIIQCGLRYLVLLFFLFCFSFPPSISYACLVVLLCVFRVCEVQGEAIVMALCLVLGWCNVMFFARGFEMLGPYLIMIQKVQDSAQPAPVVFAAHAHLSFPVYKQTCWAFVLVFEVHLFHLDYIQRSDEVHVAQLHRANRVFHLWVFTS